MKPADIEDNAPGSLEELSNSAYAYTPDPIPPNPSLSTDVVEALAAASHSLGELNGVLKSQPHSFTTLFAYKEAAASSRIEHIDASFTDLALAAADADTHAGLDEPFLTNATAYADGVSVDRPDDVEAGTIDEWCWLHDHILRDDPKNTGSGELRDQLVMIAGPYDTMHTARYVPPSPKHLPALMDNLCSYESLPDVPPILAAAIAHYQFEAIHPFHDGNGRAGRLRLTRYITEHYLPTPTLAISEQIEKHQQQYYDGLLSVSTGGTWDAWNEFILEMIRDAARDALDTLNAAQSVINDYHDRHASQGPTITAIIDLLAEYPYVTSTLLRQQLGSSPSAVQRALNNMEDAGTVTEITGKKRYRVYKAEELIDVFSP